MTSDDRDHPDRDPGTPSALEEPEDPRRALVQVVWALTALAFGKPAYAAEAPERSTYGAVFARRVARIAAGAILVASAFGLGAVALQAPGRLVEGAVATWIAGMLVYAAVRVAVAFRERRRSGARGVSRDADRYRAHRLQNASTLVPYVGFIATFVLPLGWMVDSLGAGGALSAVAMIAAALVGYVALRGALDGETAALGIDAVGAGHAQR